MKEELDKGYNLTEACKILGISRTTLYKNIDLKLIKTFNYGLSKRIKTEEINRFIKGN